METAPNNGGYKVVSVSKSGSAEQVAARLGMSKAGAGDAVDAVLDSIRVSLQEQGEVRIVGFGTFQAIHRPASTARNPRTGEPIAVPAGRRLRFKPAKGLRDAL